MSNRREVLAAALAAGLVADAAGAAEPTAKPASRIDDINAILAVEKLYEDGCVEGSGDKMRPAFLKSATINGDPIESSLPMSRRPAPPSAAAMST